MVFCIKKWFLNPDTVKRDNHESQNIESEYFLKSFVNFIPFLLSLVSYWCLLKGEQYPAHKSHDVITLPVGLKYTLVLREDRRIEILL